MATIDLQGGDAQRIRNQYRQSLGRDAADHEVEGWLSGSYHGGGSVDSYLNAIANSDEARQRNPQTPAPSQPPVVGQNPNVSRPQNNNGPDDTFTSQINTDYQQYLGRSATPEDINKWWSGAYGWGDRNNVAGITRGIQSSEEASRRRAATPTTSYPNTPYTNFQTGGNDYSAFNTARPQDPGKSAKDAFVLITNQAPPPPFHDRAAYQNWFNTYIAPGMNTLGHRVISVDENGFTYENHEGRFYIDTAQNLGAARGSMLQRLQWNATPADDATRARYAGAGAVNAPGATVPGATVPGAAAAGGPQRQTPSLARAADDYYAPGSGVDPGVPPAPPGGPDFENFSTQIQQAYQSYLGRAASPDEVQKWFSGEYGWGSGVAGLPQIVFAIQNSPEARQRLPQPNPPPTAPTNTGSVGGGGLPGDQYSDANTRLLEQLLKARIGSLQGGYDDALRQQYQSALQSRANALGQGNKQLDQLLGYLQERFTDLKGPGYTGAENEVLRTQALDPIERDRSAAKKRMLERISGMGYTPDSGIAQQLLQELDNDFDALRAQSQTGLAANDIARREDRAQRAEIIGGQIADIPDMRTREQLDVFAALENLGLVARNEDASRAREAISYGGALSDLGPQRLQLAMQAAGLGGDPSALAGTLTNIAGLNQNAAMFNRSNSAGWANALGTISAILLRSRQSGLSNFGI